MKTGHRHSQLRQQTISSFIDLQIDIKVFFVFLFILEESESICLFLVDMSSIGLDKKALCELVNY